MLFKSTLVLILCYVKLSNNKVNGQSNSDTSDYFSYKYYDSMQLLHLYGYTSAENHAVMTEDGYKINLFRIPGNGPPVLLVHGIGDSSDGWLVLGPKDGIAYLLANSGFDVWLYNSRGNKYSKENVNNYTKEKYWNFSYEEMGTQDLPATIDYVLDITNHKKLSYIGFSQGSTIFLVMCSMKPLYNGKIKQATLLAPVAKIENIKFPFIELVSRNLPFLSWFSEVARVYEVFPWSLDVSKTFYRICRRGVPERIFCDLVFYLEFGLYTDNVPEDKFPIISSHVPAGTSAKVFLHFIQGYVSKKFQRYDYGVAKNLRAYKSRKPPEYDLSLVSAPVILVVSQSDWFTAKEDVELLRNNLKNIVYDMTISESNNFTHLEFLYGSRARSMVYEPLLKLDLL